MRNRYVAALALVALASAGAAYSIMAKKAPSGHVSDKSVGPTAAQKPRIDGLKIEPAVAGEGWDSVEATGKVTVPPDRLAKVGPRIEGKVVMARATVGDRVSRGQVLAVVSSVELAEARAAYRQAVARLSAARDDYHREARIADLGATSMRPVEEARSESLASQGELSDAKGELAQARSELVRRESELTQCKARMERARELYADKIISRQDLETAEAEYKRDSASVDAAKSAISQAEARVGKAEAKLDISKQYLSREERVRKSRVMDQRILQSAKAAVAAAEIDVRAAADRIRVLGASPTGSGDTLTVLSPISGVVLARQTNVGEMATPSDVLFVVADMSRVWVEADVYEKDLARIRTGQRVEVRVEAYPDSTFLGTVESISDVLASESRTAKVRCTVLNSRARGAVLRAEMFARVRVLTARRGETVLVPKEAVLDDAGGKIVFTPCMDCPEDRKAGTNACGAYDKLTVTTGAVRGRQVEILSGVDVGTPIVTTGAYQIKTALGSGKLEAGCTDD